MPSAGDDLVFPQRHAIAPLAEIPYRLGKLLHGNVAAVAVAVGVGGVADGATKFLHDRIGRGIVRVADGDADDLHAARPRLGLYTPQIGKEIWRQLSETS